VKGLSARRIPIGKPAAGIQVIRLHYSADPLMTPDRVADLKSAYPDVTMWDREMEIDPHARGGQKWFPEFDESIHFVNVSMDSWSPDIWTTWLMCDPHPRRAHAFVWLMVNKYGDFLVPWSWWPEAVNKEREQKRLGRLGCQDYVDRLRLVENARLFPKSYIDLMDPAGANFDAEEDVNYFEKYRKAGIIFRPAKKNREYAGYDKISEALRLTDCEGVKRPRLRIVRGNGDNDILVSQIKGLRFKELKGVAAQEKDAPGDPREKERHLVDCLSYGLLDGPRFIEPKRRGESFENHNVVRAHGDRP
jgi:hypothetical protein